MKDPEKQQLLHPVWPVAQHNNPKGTTEIIRRLKIQNKKLLEQVTHLKALIKKQKTEKTSLLQRVKEQTQVNRTLSKLISQSLQVEDSRSTEGASRT